MPVSFETRCLSASTLHGQLLAAEFVWTANTCAPQPAPVLSVTFALRSSVMFASGPFAQVQFLSRNLNSAPRNAFLQKLIWRKQDCCWAFWAKQCLVTLLRSMKLWETNSWLNKSTPINTAVCSYTWSIPTVQSTHLHLATGAKLQWHDNGPVVVKQSRCRDNAGINQTDYWQNRQIYRALQQQRRSEVSAV